MPKDSERKKAGPDKLCPTPDSQRGVRGRSAGKGWGTSRGAPVNHVHIHQGPRTPGACVIGAKVGKLGSSCGVDGSILKSHTGQGNSCISLGASHTPAGARPELFLPLIVSAGPNMSAASFGPPQFNISLSLLHPSRAGKEESMDV